MKMAQVLHRLGYIEEPRVVAVHARRPRRPVRRPHRAEDEGGAPPRLRRRALHRRGVLPLQARERARLRRRGDRDPAPGDGGRARQARRDLRRLQGPDGRLLPLEPGPQLARRPPHRLPRLRRRRADGDRAPDAATTRTTSSAPAPRRRSASTSSGGSSGPRFAHGRSVRNSIDRARLRQANRLFAEGDGRAHARGADDDHPRRHPARAASSPRITSPKTTSCPRSGRM